MDVVQILKSSIEKLPKGDHSVGLASILRHISAAIRHYDRGLACEEDAYTDAIYRTNQAFEGSLKEAYRVFTGNDPSGKTPHQIESFLEKQEVLRSRVLTQLTRYRTDYRNPSTHDYKLDFDGGESLLAVLSVCGFAKLLVDQMSEKLAYSAAIDNPSKIAAAASAIRYDPKSPNFDFAKFLGSFVQTVVSDPTFAAEPEEVEGTLAGLLSAVGVDAQLFQRIPDETEADMEWDILAASGKTKVPIEVRLGLTEESVGWSLAFVERMIVAKKTNEIILLLYNSSGDDYSLREFKIGEGKTHIVGRPSLLEAAARIIGT